MNHLIPFEEWMDHIMVIDIGCEIDTTELKSELIQLGYERTGQVEAPGQFAIRGGIIDVYPLADEKNSKLYKKYLDIAASDSRVHFGGRLGSFRYYDMDDVIASALADAETLTKSR
jgi:UDP-galactopyranose mutase